MASRLPDEGAVFLRAALFPYVSAVAEKACRDEIDQDLDGVINGKCRVYMVSLCRV
jgi:hypothetical protein